MDVFEYRSQLVIDGNEDPRDDLSGCFLRLKNLTISEVHTTWDIAYLRGTCKRKYGAQESQMGSQSPIRR